MEPEQLLKDFKLTNPLENYRLDFKNRDKTASQVLDDIQITLSAMREKMIRKIYTHYEEKETRKALYSDLKTLDYQAHNVLHRWVRNTEALTTEALTVVRLKT